jgi:hypothetical protein
VPVVPKVVAPVNPAPVQPSGPAINSSLCVGYDLNNKCAYTVQTPESYMFVPTPGNGNGIVVDSKSLSPELMEEVKRITAESGEKITYTGGNPIGGGNYIDHDDNFRSSLCEQRKNGQCVSTLQTDKYIFGVKGGQDGKTYGIGSARILNPTQRKKFMENKDKLEFSSGLGIENLEDKPSTPFFSIKIWIILFVILVLVLSASYYMSTTEPEPERTQ